ncbi:hypothetical protein AWC38_SpisGene18604 [Stylophora pistillata]|uniref:Uncharacterized protein n=1 Tax=Stylophora pistillata TaxID=50429 RepID=A0A2B4RHK1_STYPI|nr:hypothetical protein AWC38_SpisGene18604 [Stylophora pistillata]
MSVFLQVCITALFLPLTVNGDRSSSPACAKPFDKMTACNLICNMIQDSDANNAMKMLQTKLQDLIAAIKNPSPLQPGSLSRPSSCKEHFEKHKWTKSQVYPLVFGSQYVPVYCHMGDFGCGDGGWTLAMKIDGRKLKFIVINKQSSSLYSLLADGKYRATSLGRSKWKKLIGSQSSLQANCNKEGFNAVGSSRRSSRARIGIIGNNEKDCASTDSRIGFGTGGSTDDKITCGNYAIKGYTSDNGEKHVKAMGYILVQ